MDIIVYANEAQEIVITVKEVLLLIVIPIVVLILNWSSHKLANLEGKAKQNGH
jgi:hypothetical protein